MSSCFLEIKNLKKVYQTPRGPVVALQGLSLAIEQGKVLALLGPNGAGKTTLVSILSGIKKPTEGQITMQGFSIYSDFSSYKKKIGIAPQRLSLDFSLNVEENLLFAARCFGLNAKMAKKRLEEVLVQFGLLPYRFLTLYALSGGVKQKVILAKAMIHEPAFLILDEPTVGLDVTSRHQLWKDIETISSQGTTILLTTHYLEEAEKLSDQICFIDLGSIYAFGSPEELKNQHSVSSLEELYLKILPKKMGAFA